jgi:predicted  nucleic acid-binding Zn-ribbon protein
VGRFLDNYEIALYNIYQEGRIVSDEILKDILGQLQQLNTSVTGLNGRIDNLESGQKQIISRVDKLENRMDSRVDKLENQMDSRMDKLDSRMDKLDSRMDKLDSRMDRLEDKMASLENGQKEHYRLIRSLEDNVLTTRAIVSRVEEDMSYIKGSLSKVEKIEKRVTEIERKVG